jgi:putative (di)nucleoside polyphosphate hydrolase
MIENAFFKEKDGIYRKNVGVVLINSKNEVFVGKRFGTAISSPSWQMPQGGVSEGETEEETLIREIKEEVGVFPHSFIILKKSRRHYYYVIPKKMRKSVWNNIYVGQKQRWFFAKFTGKDDDININTEFPEFEEWKWQKPQEVLENAVSFKKDVYEGVFIEFNLIKKSI